MLINPLIRPQKYPETHSTQKLQVETTMHFMLTLL